MTRQETAEDKAAKEKVHQIKDEEGNVLKLKVDKLLGRRKLKKDYEYEVGAGACVICWGSGVCKGLHIRILPLVQAWGEERHHAVPARQQQQMHGC